MTTITLLLLSTCTIILILLIEKSTSFVVFHRRIYSNLDSDNYFQQRITNKEKNNIFAVSLRENNNQEDDAGSITCTKVATATVNVCTSDFCCDAGSKELLQNLRDCCNNNNESSSYLIGETPCLGACGRGAMVAIDYDDGNNALVSGLDETLEELGLSSTRLMTTTQIIQEPSPSNNDKRIIVLKEPENSTEDDAVSRMRAEYEGQKEELTNPWFNAATYLFQKLTE